MVTSDGFLQFIAHLQSEGTVAQKRHTLLDYIRQSNRAQLAALFVLDKDNHTLVLREYSGPHLQSWPYAVGMDVAPFVTSIASNGLFGAALRSNEPLFVDDLYADQRTLREECAWGWRGGSVVVSAINDGNEAGVLVLSFDPENGQNRRVSGELSSDLQICSILLSMYLSSDDSKPTLEHTAKPFPEPAQPTPAYREVLREEEKQPPQTLPEMMYSLTELYEMGLLASVSIDIGELHQYILTRLRRIIRAPGGCLLLYQPGQRCFVAVASQGNELPCSDLAKAIDSREVERLALRGPGETLFPILVGENRVLLVTLSCNSVLVGIIALVATGEEALLEERALLLSHMGNVAALVLRNHEMRIAEQKATINLERSRIARDIHDGAAQQMAHVLHRLEFIQRMLEKQQNQLALAEVERAYTILSSSLSDLRHGISSLLPAQLEQQSFASALRTLLDETILNDDTLEISYKLDMLDKLPANLEVPIFRFVQEALNNVRKHAGATHITITARKQQDLLIVEIHDNGVGFQPEQVINTTDVRSGSGDSAQHVGLRTMRERIQEAGGTWEVQSKPGEGTTVKARFPLKKSSIPLTSRERDVLRLLVDGLTNRAIAERLSISHETVKSHVHRIMQKMQVKDRTQAAVIATRQHWL